MLIPFRGVTCSWSQWIYTITLDWHFFLLMPHSTLYWVSYITHLGSTGEQYHVCEPDWHSTGEESVWVWGEPSHDCHRELLDLWFTDHRGMPYLMVIWSSTWGEYMKLPFLRWSHGGMPVFWLALAVLNITLFWEKIYTVFKFLSEVIQGLNYTALKISVDLSIWWTIASCRWLHSNRGSLPLP